jgi:hypothetical protein
MVLLDANSIYGYHLVDSGHLVLALQAAFAVQNNYPVVLSAGMRQPI